MVWNLSLIFEYHYFPGFAVHLAEAEKSENTATEPTIIPESPVSEEVGAKERVEKASSTEGNVCNEAVSKQKSPESKVLFCKITSYCCLASHIDALRAGHMFCGERTCDEA